MRTVAAACCVALILLAGCEARDTGTAAPVPKAGDLNPLVLERVRAYPTDGRHGYWWPKGDPWRGTTKTLSYWGEVLCTGDPQGRCYCSGLTFEVFFDAWLAWARANGHMPKVAGMDLAAMKRFRDQWYGTSGDRQTLRTALVENGLGVDVAHDEAQRGDFVQFWRHNGSGHCAVFLEWERDGLGAVTGLRYWSTQKSSNGIGERGEVFGPHGSDDRAVKRDETWIVRAGR